MMKKNNNKERKCVIVAGAGICNYDLIKKYLCEDDYFIYCDSGLKHMDKLGYDANLIVGDFDSHENPEFDTETIVLTVAKDDTDSSFAAKEAVKRGFRKFILIGVIGARIDHSIGNLSILLRLHQQGCDAIALDDYSEISVISKKTGIATVDWNDFEYYSVLSVFGNIGDIYERNSKFPMIGGNIYPDDQFGISNEALTGETAEVEVRKGTALIVKVRRMS